MKIAECPNCHSGVKLDFRRNKSKLAYKMLRRIRCGCGHDMVIFEKAKLNNQ